MMTLEKMREAMEELDEDVMISAAEAIMEAKGEGADLCMQASGRTGGSGAPF